MTDEELMVEMGIEGAGGASPAGWGVPGAVIGGAITDAVRAQVAQMAAAWGTTMERAAAMMGIPWPGTDLPPLPPTTDPMGMGPLDVPAPYDPTATPYYGAGAAAAGALTPSAIIGFLTGPVGSRIAGQVISAVLGRSSAAPNQITCRVQLQWMKDKYPEIWKGLQAHLCGMQGNIGLSEQAAVVKLACDLALSPETRGDVQALESSCGCKV